MQDNSGLRAGDITNGAHSRNTSSSKKESSSSKNSNNTSFSQMLRDFADKLKIAEAAAAKSEKNANNVVDKFIGNLRSADSDTQKKIIERLKGQSLDEILRPDITNGAHSPARNGVKPKANTPDMNVMDEYGNYKLSDGKGVISVNPEALVEETRPSNPGPFTPDDLSRLGVGRIKPDDTVVGKYPKEFIDKLREMLEQYKPDNLGPVIGPEGKTYVYNGNGRPGTERGTIPEDVDEIEYTYKPGDTFAQFLINSGLSDGSNLWGPNGDVEYYRKQLAEQGYTGNIPVGTRLKLKKRK